MNSLNVISRLLILIFESKDDIHKIFNWLQEGRGRGEFCMQAYHACKLSKYLPKSKMERTKCLKSYLKKS